MTFSQQAQSMGSPEPIAIIGVGCKLPGNITSTDELLRALREGRDLIKEIPPERWDVDAFYDPDPVTPGKTYVRKGGFLENIETFDASFFGISDAEASRMDPQQRLVLQTVWHAIENAGLSAEELMHSNTGVFLAMMNTNSYSQLKNRFEGLPGITGYDAMGDSMSIAAGRIAHFLGLEGICLTLDTACSSSLVALHLARQSILAGDCDMAIVAGVNAILHPGIHIAFSKIGLMSRAGQCAPFDASADGYIRGEGCVAVILRRQSQAIARGDRILASVVSTSVNQDGHTPAVTAPNGRAQEKVIRSALARVGISPNDIGYLEAHGTGTPVGDPIEMSAIVNVFGPGRSDDQPLYVGSVKSNFGHIEAGAGLLGLVKTALSLQNEEILPSLHFNRLNPSIDLGRAPVHIATQRIPWPRQEKPRLASVNSFGYSGTNAHAILQEAPVLPDDAQRETVGRSLFEHDGGLVMISAKSTSSLDELVDEWIEFLDAENSIPLRDIAFTAAMGRTQLSHRLAVIGSEKDEISRKLKSWREGRIPKGLATGQVSFRVKPKIAFIFTGQGSQYPDMSRELYQTESRYKQTIDHLASILDPEMGAPLLDVLFGDKSAEYLENTRYVQPALFAIEFALADLYRHWGIEPDYVIGHSIGEIVAACIAGVLDLEDAARFVVARGRLMGQLPPGGKMLAIGASVEQVLPWIRGREAEVSIATVNGPHSVVISGQGEAVLAVGEIAQSMGRQTKELEVSHAFHSPLMDPILNELTEVAASMRISPARIPVLSNTTGDFFDEEIPADYWSTHVRQAVLFHKGMEKIIASGCTLLVELGPHPSLSPAVASAFDNPNIQTVPTLRRDGKDVNNILGSLASLFVTGLPLKLDRLYWSPVFRRVPLPLYPFRQDKHWLLTEGPLGVPPDAQPGITEAALKIPDLHPLLGKAVVFNSRKAVFETSLQTTSPWTDHRVLGSTVFPGTAYLEMAARGFAATAGLSWQAVELTEVTFERPLILHYREDKRVSLVLERSSNGKPGAKFTIAASGDNGEIYCRGRISAASQKPEGVDTVSQLNGREPDMKVGSFYGELRKVGLEYGARFANVRELWLGEPGSGEAIGRITDNPALIEKEDDPFRNVVLLDGCFHIFGAALKMSEDKDYQGVFIPASIQSIALYRELPAQVWSRVRINAGKDGRAALVEIHVLNDQGELLAEVTNLELRNTVNLTQTKQSGTATGSTTKVSTSLALKSRAQLIEFMRPLSRQERIAELAKWLTIEIKDTMGQAAEGLNIDSLPPSTIFLEIGLDSLLVTELQRRIQEKLEFRFKPMQGLNYQSVETLAGFIYDEVLSADLEAVVPAASS